MSRKTDLESVEKDLTLLLRRSRVSAVRTAQALSPELEAEALSLLIRIRDEGQTRAADLAEYFGVGRPTISRQLDILENLGFVERTPHVTDRRAQMVALTDDGASRLAEVSEERRKRFRQVFAEWSEDEISQLAASLSKLMNTKF